MIISSKLILATAIGIVGVGGFVRMVLAQPTLSPVAITSHHRTQVIAEPSDGDGETNDDNQARQEASDGDGETNDDQAMQHDQQMHHDRSQVSESPMGDGDGETNDD